MDQMVFSTQTVCAWQMEPTKKGFQNNLVSLQSKKLMDTPAIEDVMTGEQLSLDREKLMIGGSCPTTRGF